jgi:hypothetical protein
LEKEQALTKRPYRESKTFSAFSVEFKLLYNINAVNGNIFRELSSPRRRFNSLQGAHEGTSFKPLEFTAEKHGADVPPFPVNVCMKLGDYHLAS